MKQLPCHETELRMPTPTEPPIDIAMRTPAEDAQAHRTTAINEG